MVHPRGLSRIALSLLAVAALSGGAAKALIVDGGSSVNTTAAGFNSIFYNVGTLAGGSVVYLGDGWGLTAQHLTLNPGTYASFNLPNGTTDYSQVTGIVTLTPDPDLELVRLATPPSLPSIYQNITSQMTTGSEVAMVGGGAYAGAALYWNGVNVSSNGTVIMGTAPTATPPSSTPLTPVNPLISDEYWPSGSTVPQGTYQDAGFYWGSNREVQWGESVVSFRNETIADPYNTSITSKTFVTTFYNSTYDPPTNSTWASEVASIGTNMAQVASGDSGGGTFVKTSTGWSLAGILAYNSNIGSDAGSNRGASGANAAFGDLSYSIDLSYYVASIQNIVNTTATWTGQTGPGAASTSWDNTTANWANAAGNGSATFASGTITVSVQTTQQQGNAIFGDTNPQYGIHLNSSLGSTQQVLVQSAGVSAYSTIFTNTGAANGGVDYVIGDNGSSTVGINGSTGLTLSGNGTNLGGSVTLTGANSFSGSVRVNLGQLNIANAAALGSSAGVTVGGVTAESGAALALERINGSTLTKVGLTVSNSTGIPLTLYGNGIGGTGALVNLAGNNAYAGPITLASATAIGSDSTTTGDQLTLSGGLNMGLSNALTFLGPGTTTLSTTAFTASYGGTGQTGGTVTLTGGGTLALNFAAGGVSSNLLVSTSPLAVAGGTLSIAGLSSGSSQTLASLSVGSGATEISDTSNGSSSTLTFTSPSLSRSVGGTVDFTLPATGSIGFGSSPTLANGILSGWATIAGASWVALSGNNLVAYSGGTAVNSNTSLSSNTNYDVTGSFTASGAANSLRFLNGSAATTLTLSGTVPIASGGILLPSSVPVADTISGGTLEGASGADLVVIQNSSQPLTIASTIADNGSATGLTKSGAGALTLSNTNSYSGTTTLNAGTLNINNSTAIGAGTLVINGGTIDNTSGGPVSTTNPETWAGSFTYQGTNALSQTAGAITLTTTPTITIPSGAATLSISGNIGGSFGLQLAGSGTLLLAGNNTFTGGVTINGGTLMLGANSTGALNSSSPNVVGFGSVSGETLNLGGNSVSVGGLSSASSGATVEASAASGSATLTITGVGIDSFAGALANGGSGVLSLIKSGSGTQFLSGADSYTGSTTVNGGLLEFAADSNLPSGALITVNAGGAIADGAAIDQTFLNRVAGGSTGAVALGANSSSSLSFSGLSASLGSTGNYLFSGSLTPGSSGYLLGGGGGLLTLGSSSLLSGANSVKLENGGLVALTDTNDSYSLGTTISTGTTLLISSDATSAGSNAELGLVPASPTTNVTINGGTLELQTNSFAINSNRGIALGSGGGTFDIPSSLTLTYGGVISDTAGSTGGLSLSDTGTLILSGANSYTGATSIGNATLKAAAVNTLPQTSAVVLGSGGTLLLNGDSQSVGSLSGGGNVTDNSSTSVILTIGNDNTSPSAFYGVLSDYTTSNTGTLALSKVGNGETILSGLNTYSGGTTVSGGTLATISGGLLSTGSLRITAASGVVPEVSVGTSQTVSSLTTSSSGSGSAVLSISSGTTLTTTGALTNSGTLVVGAAGSGTGTLLLQSVPTLNAGSKLQINAGTVEFDATSGSATVKTGVTATVAAAATLQLAGTVSAFSDGSAQTPSDGQLVNIVNNGAAASGGGLDVTGTNQSVGSISGSQTTLGQATVYNGDTVVAAGANLTASQILQNSLEVGADSTVTIRPTGNIPQSETASAAATSGSASSETSMEVERLQNKIALLESLAAEESGSATSASPLDTASTAAIGSATASSNSAVANPASGVSDGGESTEAEAEIATLLNTENSLLASENLPPVTLGGSLSDSISSTGSLSGNNAVPEPSAILLALLGACMAAAWAGRRFFVYQADNGG